MAGLPPEMVSRTSPEYSPVSSFFNCTVCGPWPAACMAMSRENIPIQCVAQVFASLEQLRPGRGPTGKDRMGGRQGKLNKAENQ